MQMRRVPKLRRGEAVSKVADVDLPYLFRKPTAADGRAVWELIACCPPLDTNSLYCNLLQCTHFADTCVLAEQDGEIRGWVSAYRPPTEPQALFIWQVAIRPNARRGGLASALIRTLLARDAVRGTQQLKTTVTPDNRASWALFRSLAKAWNAPFTSQEHFERDADFGGHHESERMLTIGPWRMVDAAEDSPARAAGSVA
jgi:L-2,4-diaminobutyric acid acetyltransferase